MLLSFNTFHYETELSTRKGILADNKIMLLLCSVLMCNTQYYLNDDISLFTGCCVNPTVQSTTFLYLTKTNKRTDGNYGSCYTGMCTSLWNMNNVTMCHEWLVNWPHVYKIKFKHFKTLSHTKKKKKINSLQITRTVLIILHISYNELHKMNSLQDRLLYYKKNNKK